MDAATDEASIPVIASEQVSKSELNEKPGKDQSYQVRIDLPLPPTPSLLNKNNANSSVQQNEESNLAIMISCLSSENLHDLKSLVLEMDGFWLGAFQFVKVPNAGESSDVENVLESNSEVLNEWSEVGTIFHEPEYQDPSVVRVLKVVEVAYTETEARSHVLRARDLFNNMVPSMIARQIPRAPPYDPNALTIDAGLSLFASIRDSNSKQVRQLQPKINGHGHTTPDSDGKENQAVRKGHKKSKSKSQINGNHSLTNGHVSAEEAIEKSQHDSSTPHAFTSWSPTKPSSNPTLPLLQKRESLAAQPSPPVCVKNFGLSPWNPPAQHLKLRGHLLYLNLTTLEGEYYHITSSTAGFYIDKSDNGHFDPSPRSSKSIAERQYSSLFALLADLSPKFVAALKDMSDPVGPLHPDTFLSTAIQNCSPASPWLVQPPSPTPDFMRSQLVYLSTGSLTTESLPDTRNWNDEFITIRDLPRTTVQERLYRERLLAKTFSEMSHAATRAVVGIIHGDIIPANPHEDPALHTVVHQNLLLVPAKDAGDNFVHLGGEEAVRQSVGKDVAGARLISSYDIEGINLTPAIVVDYLGQRWVAQPILPGILSGAKVADADKRDQDRPGPLLSSEIDGPSSGDNSEPEETEIHPGFKILYGGSDTDNPEKNYVADQSFEPLAQKVASHLLLAKHNVYDIDGKATSLWISADTKGVLGQDGNKYLIDLYRLHPTDIGFMENDLDGDLHHNPSVSLDNLPTYDSADVRYPHRFVLIRPELLEAYKDTELRAWIYRQVAENNARKEAEAKTKVDALVRRENETEEQASRRAGLEALVESLQQPQTIININEFELAFNPDAYVPRKDQTGAQPPAEEEPSTKAVRDASIWLRSTAITSFLTDCVNNGTLPADGTALSKLLHSRGLNIRYLGLIAATASVDKLEVPEKHLEFAQHALKILIGCFEREMFVRGAKHALRGLLAGRDLQEVAPIISHFLNCLLGTAFNSRPAPDTSNLPPTTRERPWTKLTPESLRRMILLQIASRYRYNLSPAYFDSCPKYQLLREVCVRNGIQLQNRDYYLIPPAECTEQIAVNGKQKKRASKAPIRERLTSFEPEDVACVCPIVKDIPHKSPLADELFEQGSSQVSAGNIVIGEGMVSDAINYYEQIFGSVHPELATRYHELAVSYHQLSLPLMRNVNAYETSKEGSTTEARVKGKAETTIENDEGWEQAKRELRGFIESAVQMNRQAIIVAERTLGVDHHTTAQQYVDLAILEHANGDILLGLHLCRHAIELFEQIFGPNHPEAIRATTNAAQMVVQWQGHSAAVPIFQAAVDMNLAIRGTTAVATGNTLSQLANAMALAGDLHGSQKIARQTRELYDLRLGAQDEKTLEAENLYDVLTKAIVNREKGEQAKLGRLARRLGLNEERAKQLMERTSAKGTLGSNKESKTINTSSITKSEANGISELPLQELVSFIQGNGQALSKKGKGVDR